MLTVQAIDIFLMHDPRYIFHVVLLLTVVNPILLEVADVVLIAGILYRGGGMKTIN